MKPEELTSVILNLSSLFLFSVVLKFTGNTTLILSDCEPTQQNASYITLKTEKCNVCMDHSFHQLISFCPNKLNE